MCEALPYARDMAYSGTHVNRGGIAVDEYVERRKRGFFGWVFLLVFLCWNALMAYWLVKVMGAMGNMGAPGADVGENGRTAAQVASFGIILLVWALGSVITGLPVMMTRGSKTVVRRR
jgi:hypothetical protein